MTYVKYWYNIKIILNIQKPQSGFSVDQIYDKKVSLKITHITLYYGTFQETPCTWFWHQIPLRTHNLFAVCNCKHEIDAAILIILILFFTKTYLKLIH